MIEPCATPPPVRFVVVCNVMTNRKSFRTVRKKRERCHVIFIFFLAMALAVEARASIYQTQVGLCYNQSRIKKREEKAT